jgi:hypothetical protein
MNTSMKSWATPLAASTVIILAVTGTLMFFHVDAGYIKPVHEWLSWAMTAGVILHVIANWKLFTGYFSRKPALAIIGLGVIVTALSIFTPASQQSNPRKNMLNALESAKLETIATVVGQSSETIIEKLEDKGITSADPSMTIRDIASKSGKNEMAVLGVIFDQPISK